MTEEKMVYVSIIKGLTKYAIRIGNESGPWNNYLIEDAPDFVPLLWTLMCMRKAPQVVHNTARQDMDMPSSLMPAYNALFKEKQNAVHQDTKTV